MTHAPFSSADPRKQIPFRQKCVFHGGDNCYREAVPTMSAQCCYNTSGNLTGGDVDKVNPDNDLWGHLIDDVIPHFF